MLFGIGVAGRTTFLKSKELLNKQEQIIGEIQNLKDACESKIALVVKQIMQNENHPLFPYFMRSGKRLRSMMNCRTKRSLNSFVLFAIRMYNQSVT